MNVLKKIGRFFLVLTEEERYINPADIKAVLIVDTGEGHFKKAFKVASERFKAAEIKTVSGNKIAALMIDIHRLKEGQFSAVIVLSLNPFVILSLILNFDCYFLIYNKLDQWFLIRRKTLYEFLAGRKGADREERDWDIPPARLNFAKCMTAMLILPAVFIKNVFRLIRLIGYILVNLSGLFAVKLYYRIKRYV